jgi:hypothetical protein
MKPSAASGVVVARSKVTVGENPPPPEDELPPPEDPVEDEPPPEEVDELTGLITI